MEETGQVKDKGKDKKKKDCEEIVDKTVSRTIKDEK